MKQILEHLPGADTLATVADLLRYENAAQKMRIAALEGELETASAAAERLEAAVRKQQQVIDLLNAEIVRLRGTER